MRAARDRGFGAGGGMLGWKGSRRFFLWETVGVGVVVREVRSRVR